MPIHIYKAWDRILVLIKILIIIPRKMYFIRCFGKYVIQYVLHFTCSMVFLLLLKFVCGKHMYNYVSKPTTPMNWGELFGLAEERALISSCFYEFNHQIFKNRKLWVKCIIYRLPDGLYDLLFTDILDQKNNKFLSLCKYYRSQP